MPTEENSKGRLRAVLDTNTLISAVLTPEGIASRIVLHAQENDFKADYIVTGDKRHLLPLKKFRGIQIVSPREFLAELLEHRLK